MLKANMTDKRITQKQIAELAGVSDQIVSRVLNNRDQNPRCRPEVAERIMKIAQEHIYRLNRVASLMKNQKTGVLGIITKDIMDIQHNTFQAIVKAAKTHNYIVAIEQMEASNPSTLTFIKEKVVDGIILSADISSESDYLTKTIHEPILHYNAFKTKGKNVVIHNEYQGAELAVECLVKAGRKKIIFVIMNDKYSYHYSRINRQKGIIKSCEKHNIKYINTIECVDPKTVDYLALESLEAASNIASKLKNIDFDGAILYSDRLVGHFYEAMKIMNKEIPKDCSVIAFNYSDITKVLRPRLTSVYIPYETIGKIIINRMVALIDDKDIEKEEVLDYKLMDCDSV
jgi:LacI family transcriptional regulator